MELLTNLINEATEAIINEIGTQIIDNITRENIREKVIQIVDSGVFDIDTIVQEFFDDNENVAYHSE